MYTISHNTPQAGCIQWTGLHMQYQGESYTIEDGWTNAAYAYWTQAYPTNLVVSNTYPELDQGDCLVFLNKSGIALVVPGSTAVDGGLIVPGTILADALAANSVTADAIAAGAVTAKTLAVDAVGATAIAANAVMADALMAGAVTAEKIDAGAVTADKLAANAVIAGKIATNAVTAGTIAAGAVTVDKLAAKSVTTEKIASDAVTTDKIVAGAITAAEIAAKTITANELAANSVTAEKIVARTITADKIAFGAITTNELAAKAVTAAKIDVTNLFAQDITATGTIRGVNLVGATGSFTGDVTANNFKIKNNVYMWVEGEDMQSYGKMLSLNQCDTTAGARYYELVLGKNTGANLAENQYTTLKFGRVRVPGILIVGSTDVEASISTINSNLAQKLPLSGGTINGNLTVNGSFSAAKDINGSGIYASWGVQVPLNTAGLMFGNQGRIWSPSGQHLYFRASPEPLTYLHYGVHDNMWTFDPDVNNVVALGTANHRWTQLYVAAGSISTSDAKLKKDIAGISEVYEDVFFKLHPSTYRFKDGKSGRIHTGFISQEAEDALKECGLSTMDWAAVCKDKDVSGEDYVYGLRYEEIIALNTHMIQKLYEKVQKLTEKVL